KLAKIKERRSTHFKLGSIKRYPAKTAGRPFGRPLCKCAGINTPLVNKVAASGIITLDPMDLFHSEPVVFDLKEHLYMGMILKEKPFREALKNLDTSIYDQLTVTVTCSADAIIPKWAYMLVVQTLLPVAKKLFFGSREDAITLGWLEYV